MNTTNWLGLCEELATQLRTRQFGPGALDRAADLLQRQAALAQEVWDLIGESYGVAGLHLNGDLAPWEELLPGGRFERLLSLPPVSNEEVEG